MLVFTTKIDSILGFLCKWQLNHWSPAWEYIICNYNISNVRCRMFNVFVDLFQFDISAYVTSLSELVEVRGALKSCSFAGHADVFKVDKTTSLITSMGGTTSGMRDNSSNHKKLKEILHCRKTITRYIFFK